MIQVRMLWLELTLDKNALKMVINKNTIVYIIVMKNILLYFTI